MKTTIETNVEKMPPLEAAIAGHHFTAEMKPEHLKKLLASAMFKQFDRDEVIFRECEPANRFYLICSGKIALESMGDGESAPLVQFVGPEEVSGWSWLFPPFYWHFSARAVEPTTAVFFYGTRLREQCEEDPAFGYELMKRTGIVGLATFEGCERIMCVGQYCRNAGTEDAEMAITVHDKWQGHGLEAFLLNFLSRIALANGISVFTADVAADNYAMVRLIRKRGKNVESTLDSGIYHFRFALDNTGDPGQPAQMEPKYRTPYAPEKAQRDMGLVY